MKGKIEIEYRLDIAKGNLSYCNNALKHETSQTKLINQNLIKMLERQIVEINEEIKILNWILENK